jgi:hypothetical protein
MVVGTSALAKCIAIAAHHSSAAAPIITRKGFKTAFVNKDLHSVRVSGAASIEAKHAPQIDVREEESELSALSST